MPLRYQLQSGDTVEIITTTNQTPIKDWLKLREDRRAPRRASAAYIKEQQRQRAVAVGREILGARPARHQLDLAKLRKDGTARAAC